MLVLGLLAILAVSVGLPLATRRAARRGNYPTVTLSTGNVAVLIAARDRADRIVGALNSAARVVSLPDIYVVSDDSTDGTAELARDYGVRVVETYGRQGRAGAIESGIQAFRLLDEFPFVLLADVDTQLDPHHLERVLPVFDDQSVAAVDVRVDTENRGASRAGVLAAYRARCFALAGRGRTGTVPSVARTYRTSCLRELELNPPGLAVADFDLTRQIYRRQLGRVALCSSVVARTATPTRFAGFRAQHRQWSVGYWQAVRRDGFHPLAVAAVLLPSLLFALAPLAFLLSPAIGAAIVLSDFLLTIPVAVARRQPGYLLPGLAFPLLRWIDVVETLTAPLRRQRAEWLAFGESEPPAPVVKEPKRRNLVLAALAWLLAAGAGALLVIRVARTTATLPPAPAETGLVDAAYGTRPSPGGSLAVTEWQLREYTSIASAFGRHGSVLEAARELSVVCAVVIVLGMLAVAAILRVHPLVTALVMGMVAVSGPAITLLTPVGPGLLAAPWLAIASATAVAAIGWRHYGWLAGTAIALPAALITAPILIIPIGAGVAAWLTARAGKFVALAVLAGIGGAAVLLWRAGLLLTTAGPLEARQRLGVLGVAAAAVIVGLFVAWLRPVAVGIGAGAVLVAAVGAGADVLLPALMIASVLLVAVMVEEAVTAAPALTVRIGVGVAALVAIAAAGVGALLGPRSWTPPDHAAIAKWATENLEGGVQLIAPVDLRSDLDRDLARAGRAHATAVVGSPTGHPALLIAVEPHRSVGVQLASFGSVAVLSTDTGYIESSTRLGPGRQLATNPRLDTSDEVRAAIRDGQVDLRAMAVLAAICREHVITVADAENPAHERGSPQPDRVLILSKVDGQPVDSEARAAPLITWLRAQLPPYAPADVRVTPAGLRVGWRLPARLDLPFF